MASGTIKKDTLDAMSEGVAIPAHSSVTVPVAQTSWYFITWTTNIGSCFWIVASSGNINAPFNCIKNIDDNPEPYIIVTAGTGFNLNIENTSNYDLGVKVLKVSKM